MIFRVDGNGYHSPIVRNLGYEQVPMKQKRQKAWRAGIYAEWLAALWLMLKGYRVLACRYKTPVGEVDLVVRRRNRLAFVEVKRRRDASRLCDAVTPQQQRRIRRAAEYWLSRHREVPYTETGFDVIAISPWKRPRHYKDAFSHTGY